jgi:hypothetical protein
VQARVHPWLPPTWRGCIDAVHRDNAQRLATLLARLQAAGDAFAALPVDAALAAEIPTPVAVPA